MKRFPIGDRDPDQGQTLDSDNPSSRFAVMRRVLPVGQDRANYQIPLGTDPISEELVDGSAPVTLVGNDPKTGVWRPVTPNIGLGTRPLLWTLRIFEWGQTPDKGPLAY